MTNQNSSEHPQRKRDRKLAKDIALAAFLNPEADEETVGPVLGRLLEGRVQARSDAYHLLHGLRNRGTDPREDRQYHPTDAAQTHAVQPGLNRVRPENRHTQLVDRSDDTVRAFDMNEAPTATGQIRVK